jgi:hypothetical protein
VTKCQYLDNKITSCAQLEESGALPKGVQAYEAAELTGAQQPDWDDIGSAAPAERNAGQIISPSA